MQLQLCDGVKQSRIDRHAAMIFITALVFLYRPIMAAGFMTWAGITIFSQGLFVLLAMVLVLLRWETFRSVLINTGWTAKICAGVLLGMGLLHWIGGGFYRPEYLGISLYWCILPIFGAVYRNDLERKLPTALGFFWLANVIVCIWTESAGYGMHGITGNWNWSAILMLISIPFAIRCIPQNCRGRRIYIVLMLLVTFVLMVYLQSRAMVLSGAAAAGFWLFMKFRKARIALAAAFVLLILAGGYMAFKVYPERTQNFLKNEIRVELWKSAVNMIRDVPTGAGVVEYENISIPYRTIEYFKHRHATLRDPHPHNEVLYLAATLGVAAAAAFLVWIIIALIRAVQEYDKGFMSRKRVLFLLSFIVILCSSMLDLTLQVWPVGYLGLLYFGMFAFPGKRTREEAAAVPANKIGKILLAFTILLALINLAGTFCWEASHDAVRRMNTPAAKKYAKAALLLAPEIPNLIYRAAMDMAPRDRDFSMELADRMQESPWRDYCHIHGLKAMLFAVRGENEKAIEEYMLDAKCYPLQILPCWGILMAYGRMGRQDLFFPVVMELRRRIKARNLTPEQIKAIHKQPEYDLHPERIGVPHQERPRWQLPQLP
ncbi:MAG: O-antigen ligase family protein [Lentisphaeria bacterium]|nr:O-antigen ligase family protein [Lentisphaeria bacterium]